jgi:hypothetical protein
MEPRKLAGLLARRAARLALVAIGTFPMAALARDSAAWHPPEDSAVWRKECGACHIPFPPRLLAVDDWLVIMAELDRHYGSDASLDAKTRDEIAAFLERNAGPAKAFGSREETPRITTADWFVRKHRGAIRMLMKGKVKSLAECAACHKGPEIERMMAD